MNKYSIAIISFALPAVVSAQRFDGTVELINGLKGVINLLLPVVAGIALLAFFWGLAKFVYGSGNGDESAIKAGKSVMIWGVIALFVLVSIWGIVSFVGDELGIDNTVNDSWFGGSGSAGVPSI